MVRDTGALGRRCEHRRLTGVHALRVATPGFDCRPQGSTHSLSRGKACNAASRSAVIGTRRGFPFFGLTSVPRHKVWRTVNSLCAAASSRA